MRSRSMRCVTRSRHSTALPNAGALSAIQCIGKPTGGISVEQVLLLRAGAEIGGLLVQRVDAALW
ncbi:protein of unknown function [Aminobacter niigataensis]|nr:protein of unknown function [Aminobacter niigataensis]